jgi:hypothetical protein
MGTINPSIHPVHGLHIYTYAYHKQYIPQGSVRRWWKNKTLPSDLAPALSIVDCAAAPLPSSVPSPFDTRWVYSKKQRKQKLHELCDWWNMWCCTDKEPARVRTATGAGNIVLIVPQAPKLAALVSDHAQQSIWGKNYTPRLMDRITVKVKPSSRCDQCVGFNRFGPNRSTQWSSGELNCSEVRVSQGVKNLKPSTGINRHQIYPREQMDIFAPAVLVPYRCRAHVSLQFCRWCEPPCIWRLGS